MVDRVNVNVTSGVRFVFGNNKARVFFYATKPTAMPGPSLFILLYSS